MIYIAMWMFGSLSFASLWISIAAAQRADEAYEIALQSTRKPEIKLPEIKLYE